MRYQAVIWDWNGTLLDDIDICIELANEILDDHDLPLLTHDTYKDIFDFPVSRYWERAGMDLSAVDFDSISARFCQNFEDRLHAIPMFNMAASILADIHGRGARQFILSNTEQSSLINMLQSKDVHQFFHEAKGREDTLATGKIDVGRRLMTDHALHGTPTVLVGDTLHDLEVAEALEIDCILVSTGHHSHERLTTSDVPVVASLDAILEHV